ncbi:MAG TPA: hypothetical protein VH021_06215 [Trebonia sp.]|nr:hypothetical protein [Trebonia sp.]
MTGDRVVWAVVTCGAIVLAAEPPTIALLRRRRVLDVPGTRSSHSIATPRGGGAPIAVGLLAATDAPLQRTHVYQRWCDAGWSHAEVTVLTSALTVTLCLLGLAGLLGGAEARAAADLAGLGVLAAYLGSPGLFARAGLDAAPGTGGVAGLIVAPYAAGRAEAISEMEKA